MLFQYDTIAIYNALQKGEGKPFSPALTQEDIAHIRSSPNFAPAINLLEQAGKEWMGKPIPSILYSNFRQYDETGARGETEKEYSNRRYRLNAFAMLSMLFPERGEYLTELENVMWAICDEYTWSAPAHLVPKGTDVRVPKPRYNEKGLIDNSSYAHVHQLDLFACETSFALCEISALLEDRLAPQVVYRARTECYRRILTPYLDLTGLWKWEKGTNNWSAVCAGSIGMTAMYLIADSSVLTPIIQRLLTTLDGYMGGLSDDGVCVEGPSYWRYGMSFFCGFAETLRRRTDGALNLFGYDKVRSVAEFQQKVYMTENHVVSFSDSAKEINFRLGLAVFLKNEYDTVRIPDLNYFCPVLGAQGGSHRWCTDYRDIYWVRNFDFRQEEPDPIRVYRSPIAQQFIARERPDGHTVCFAAKGGHNAQPHNHNDVGSIIYHVDGDSLLIDLGRGKYSKAYFQQRYTQVCNSSRGHSVPIVNGEFQKPGAEYACSFFEMPEMEDGHRVEIGMEKAYGLSYLSSLHRSLLFEKNGKLTITDHCISEQSIVFTSRLVTKSRIVLKGERVFIEGERARAELIYDAALVKVSLDAEHMEVHSAEEKPQPGNNVFMVDFTSKEKQRQHTISIQVAPIFE